MNKKTQQLIKKLPESPGVYLFKNSTGEILYVGKAKNIKKRVSSYFQNKKGKSVRIQKLTSQICDIGCTATSSELEAIILETNLIKQFRPKYNILMKDDKNFVYIKTTVNEDFPQISIVRKLKKDGALYFGPKTAAHKAKKTLEVLKKLFPYRHCNLFLKYEKNGNVTVGGSVKKYPCLDYHIGRCIGPCVGNCTKEEYNEIISKIVSFLSGKSEELINSLKEEMQNAAAEKKFEKAAKLRDKLKAVEEISKKQIASIPNRKDADAFNYFEQLGRIHITLFVIRDGKLINQENFLLKSEKNSEKTEDEEIVKSFIQQYYQKTADFPEEILIPHSMEEKELINKWLSNISGKNVKIVVPQRGEKLKIIELALKNAKIFATQSKAKWQVAKDKRKKALEELKTALDLPKVPKRIECYDVSHISGTDQTASMIVFENGLPSTKKYKRFKIKTLKEGKTDDFAAMREVLNRRFLYLVKSKSTVKTRRLRGKDSKTVKGYLGKKIIATCEHETCKDYDYFSNIKFKSEKDASLRNDFITALLKRAKNNRVYVVVPREKRSLLETTGFRDLRKNPGKIKTKKDEICMLFDKSKYAKEKDFSEKPDLIVVDGGRGQLSKGFEIEKKYSIDIPIIALAKKNEEIYVPKRKDTIKLPKNSEGLYLLQQVRDEAHRFALSYHRKLRSKSMLK